MLVVDLKQDDKNMRFSIAAKIARILKFFKAKWVLRCFGFSKDEINRHLDAAHFLMIVEQLSNLKGLKHGKDKPKV